MKILYFKLTNAKLIKKKEYKLILLRLRKK